MTFDEIMIASNKRIAELYEMYTATFNDCEHSKGGLAVTRAKIKRDSCILSLVWECAVALHTIGGGDLEIKAEDSKIALQKLGLEE